MDELKNEEDLRIVGVRGDAGLLVGGLADRGDTGRESGRRVAFLSGEEYGVSGTELERCLYMTLEE